MLLAIDPSSVATRTGWAVFDHTTLVACGWSAPSPAWLEGVTEAILERPVIYPGGRTRNPNDIVKLAVATGELAGVLMANGVDLLRYVEPRAWKRTLDPDTCCRRVWGRLRADEAYTARDYQPESRGPIRGGKDHVLDAIGIGLYAVGRFNR